jgi:two-component system, response regulator PdtaR
MAAPDPVTVVVAEDEAVIRMDLVEQLRELGYDVVGQCGDGQAAIRLCQELNPAVALLDISMPELDGLAAAGVISRSGRTAVVMLTAYSQRELVEQAVAAGAMAYLVKPWSPTELVPAIELARARSAELRALTSQVDELAESLRARKVVERAKAKLMAAYGISEADAFRRLQKAAMDRRTAMVTVADEILDRASAEGTQSDQITQAGVQPDLPGGPGMGETE